MKKIILLCLSMFLVTFYGCNKKDVDPVHYFYSIALTFENQSGDNLVTGIPYSEKEQRIPYSEYTRTAWAENGIELLTAELKTIKDENGKMCADGVYKTDKGTKYSKFDANGKWLGYVDAPK